MARKAVADFRRAAMPASTPTNYRDEYGYILQTDASEQKSTLRRSEHPDRVDQQRRRLAVSHTLSAHLELQTGAQLGSFSGQTLMSIASAYL